MEPTNNKRIHGAKKNESNAVCSKKTKVMQKLDKNDVISHMSSTNDTNIDLCVPQKQFHYPKNDGNYGFRALAMAIFGDEEQVLSYTDLGIASQKYWFYSPECVQLTSDTFDAPVIVLAAESYSFMLLN
ncbi:17090_t:CDS:2 [Dentiscutata erythropus]|uniref:17090_t:CDS:1 n=1 Tax=Dentiscutata erythropus TaxID=1348616 RepID=A0A9N8VI37_9GLOM|nr:17090_t:CDS:2 [Dentiscutata erythropus]